MQHRAHEPHERRPHRHVRSSHHAPPPLKEEDGVEIPQATKRRLGLDTEPSWIITTELNRFTWPSPDLRPTAAGEYVYGYLPEKLMRLVLDRVRKHARDKRLKTVPRSE